MRAGIPIKKAGGYEQSFSEEKLLRSLRRCGATELMAKKALERVKKNLKPGVPSHQILKWALQSLKKESKGVAARYNLRRALIELGPTGFPFEKLISRLLNEEGYETQLNQKIDGTCVSHEIDVLANKGGRRILIECKFRNQPGSPLDIKTALYVFGRAQDLSCLKNNSEKSFALYTNSKLSSDALQYLTCIDLPSFAWDFPEKNSLQKRLETKHLYPLTCLTQLRRKHQKQLLDEGFITCTDLARDPSVLRPLRLKEGEETRIREEIDQLLLFR